MISAPPLPVPTLLHHCPSPFGNRQDSEYGGTTSAQPFSRSMRLSCPRVAARAVYAGGGATSQLSWLCFLTSGGKSILALVTLTECRTAFLLARLRILLFLIEFTVWNIRTHGECGWKKRVDRPMYLKIFLIVENQMTTHAVQRMI